VGARQGTFAFLGETIRQHIAWAEEIAADDLQRSRRIMCGDYSS
jgi:hypothetical protein